MRVLNLIEDKKRGREHPPAEIAWLVREFSAGRIPDYQMTAWLMAVCFQGLTATETEALTHAMAASGETLVLEGLRRPWLDKHSTGGVGDKLSLVIVPLLAAAGATVVKLSGRGLGHTGGTVDKLDSIPGFVTALSKDEILACARRAGGCLAAHSGSLVPADGKMYALRDVTATVDSIPLIAASIMSKKFASGAETIVLDVKVGEGGFLTRMEDARRLARTMVALAAGAGRRATAALTAMDEPIGLAVGNALEVEEACAVLRGEGPRDVRHLSVALAAEALYSSGLCSSPETGAQKAEGLLRSGAGLRALAEIVAAQGGDPAVVYGGGRLPTGRFSGDLRAAEAGTLARVSALAVGRAAVLLGAGRSRKGDPVDPGAGVVLRVKPGTAVGRDDRLATAYAGRPGRLAEGLSQLEQAFIWEQDPVARVSPRAAGEREGVLEIIRGPG